MQSRFRLSIKSCCKKAYGNRPVKWTTIFEEMKTKAISVLESESKSLIYAQLKMDVERFLKSGAIVRFAAFYCWVMIRSTRRLGMVVPASNFRRK